ncbi:RdgB/HAM1 family non-canonical purine NTP pyrophosphatase [Pararhodobacter zhoushanensis]|uniref:dITP/XTP pyrophosphatase n=1 Tax=Pararhodobacter zhoushanensis TaxID=2479545 RepID=A0ABT3GUM2_9RHOB|nr:RdgB/HAM1 family non-canonical purine NTP pyrophosphatase [Pararhodobacter zhoushanensis]MCW1931241.1 RdgB/HAM1 family non-canonical purine NTP pyrophosphatase [Pararhodobacter zhoushanensis]
MSLAGTTLLFATHNAGKVEEMRQLLSPYGVTVVSAAERGLPEPEETEDSFVGNARIKAHAAAKATGLVVLADDSGLCVDALDGAPGVYTADWAEGPGGRDFMRAMEKTRAALGDAPEPWGAEFRCTLVMAWPDGTDEVYEGVVRGTLVWPIRGAQGHGYDPMFVPEGEDVTFAEMTAAQKNALSHRARALQALIGARFT